ncbi:glycosyltransferase family 25 protein [Mesorhizobium sp. M1406]|uniref:glycosyltransferase family 25 protein n=1 Tax=Mesorhizobium sp. M1406 TaxID=2957099 RepID=UPI00333C6398
MGYTRQMPTFPADQVYVRVCHVKQGYEDREQHIARQIGRHGIPATWYLHWDVADITDEEVERLTVPGALKLAELSCSLKHIGIWRDFLKTDKPYCLVLEDDVFLAANFNTKFNAALAELGDPNRKAAIYIGNAGTYYISAFKLKRGQHLYPAPHGRSTDSYIITRSVAAERCAWFDARKMSAPIGHEIDRADAALGVEVLWFERPFVEQGTHNGAFLTSINPDSQRPLWYKRMEWRYKKYRRQLVGHM